MTLNPKRSKVNSTDKLLLAGATFTGIAEDVSAFSSLVISVKTDQNGTYLVQFSPDGENWDSSLTRYYRTNQIEPPHRFTVTRRYMRVLFTNTSSSNQTFMRLQVMLGEQSDLNIPLDAIMSQDYDSVSVRPTNYNYEVALGRRQGSTTWNKFGYNSDVDSAATEVVASFGGAFVPLTTASTLSVVSTSTSDTSAGTGAQSVVIIGVDANRVAQTEVVTLNGTTPVVTTSTWLGINRMAIYLAGSGKANAGTITATGGAATQGEIPTGQGTSQQAIFFTQVDHHLLADFLSINAEKTGGGASPKVRVRGWVYSAVSNANYLVYDTLVDTSAESSKTITPQHPFIIGESSVLWFEATTDQNDTFISVRFSGIEVRDIQA
jgi:hypothetical protein